MHDSSVNRPVSPRSHVLRFPRHGVNIEAMIEGRE